MPMPASLRSERWQPSPVLGRSFHTGIGGTFQRNPKSVPGGAFFDATKQELVLFATVLTWLLFQVFPLAKARGKT